MDKHVHKSEHAIFCQNYLNLLHLYDYDHIPHMLPA